MFKHNVYVDITKDTNEIFYVGKGLDSRIFKKLRNKKHTAIVKKHGFNRTIIYVALGQTKIDANIEARRAEIEKIAEYHTFEDDPLANKRRAANLTSGGEGQILCESSKKAISEKLKGRIESEETRKRKSVAQKKRHRNNPFSSEIREKLRIANLNKIVSCETRTKISKNKKGRIPWNKGISISDEQRQRCRLASLGKKHSDKTKQLCRLAAIRYRESLKTTV